MKLNAFAKINLGLHVVAKRNDGFHDIETVFHRLALRDVISLEPHATLDVSVSNPEIPSQQENLCWKAAALLQRELHCPDGVRIHITKNIPAGAGLGGGSSDAAAVLKNLPLLWNKVIVPRRLQELALELGSDVPYFLTESSAYAEGRGEKLSYFPLRLPYWIVVVYPNIHVATPWAYTALSEKRNGLFPARESISRLFPHPSVEALLSIGNDFEEVVFDRYPEIARVKTSLLHFGAVRSLMSGSGSSVFGLFEHKTDADAAAAEFSKQYFTHVTEPN